MSAHRKPSALRGSVRRKALNLASAVLGAMALTGLYLCALLTAIGR
jgi:hypothetical protein